MIDIRMLDEISRKYDVGVYLFFEEDACTYPFA